MAQIVEQPRQMERAKRDGRVVAVRTVRTQLAGKRVQDLTPVEQRALLVALAQALGWADAAGVLE